MAQPEETVMINEEILKKERAFFDEESEGLSDRDLVMPEDVIDRYRKASPNRWNAPKTELFARILPLEGKTVLDYGCGNGENSLLLAACGARVTGFDLSPQSVEKARRRSELHGMDQLTRFEVQEAGQTGYPSGSFDLVIGFNVLHHLHMILPKIYEETARLVRPAGAVCFIEPVANSPVLRFLRRITPVRIYATEDERQLTARDFEPLKSYFGSIEFQYFYCLGRMHRLLPDRAQEALLRADHYLQSVFPFMRRYYGKVLVIARAPLA